MLKYPATPAKRCTDVTLCVFYVCMMFADVYKEVDVPERVPLHARLRADLVAGRFAADDHLVETMIAELYGVSRTPVREALNRLEQEGLIVRAMRGFRIRSGGPEDVIEIYDVRIALERAAAESAASLRTELHLAELTQLHQQSIDAAGDPALSRALHSRFHEVLWDASQNVTLQSMLAALVARLRIFDRETHHRDDRAETGNEHAEILSALHERNATRAGVAVVAHLARTKQERLDTFVRDRVRLR
ncbi:DNA-binding transcriptional regulator, GntR family [Microbacterium azadirachtae]|uniref:DNA-binding transcriptional regulator, GntR family n=2 Tax=Microbacterium azadirachtae TaxID=582680 RepID=A0A1I6G8T1_9MICO|nr:DNA-binding transcriptional regulator, GntR family [Microbacterium azadirachtae]SEF68413.1 DNA-binding transcriptional regulator, GntR family [Microbacterium azadirachtae]SEF69095.1 DNA-binding transcriptional regulator, GntR family [Microbacterium azadirachtae]SFR38477.1 DNA-binding transcriptional regulator, GntR family [Microbacterium azadirachtae]